LRKEQFLNYKEKITFCNKCQQNLHIDNFNYEKIRLNGTGVCRACEWIAAHKEKINNSTYDENVLKIIVHQIFENESLKINNLVNIIKIDLDTIIDMIEYLKIGNKHYYVDVPCEACNKSVTVNPAKYKSNKNIYCSQECYWNDKTNKVDKGKDSVYYNRIKTTCSNCGKEIEIIPSQYDIMNRYNDNHNFCSQKCYWIYRGKYYINEKSNTYNMKISEDVKNRMREDFVKRMSGLNRLNTKPQKIVDDLLDELNIKYEREYPIKYYSIDNYLVEYNLMIEVMGDYWHANPNRYNENKYSLNKIQMNGIHRDKLKHSYILNHENIEILYLWEYDLVHDPQKCKELIDKYIKSNGVLSDYHSLNYKIIDSLLTCCKTIVPYQNKTADEYRHLLKNVI